MVIWEFIIHLLVGSVIFAVIAAGVVGMELLRSRLGIFAAGSFIASVLRWFEVLTISIDAILLGIFSLRSIASLIKKLGRVF
jgi:hypothetical protein